MWLQMLKATYEVLLRRIAEGRSMSDSAEMPRVSFLRDAAAVLLGRIVSRLLDGLSPGLAHVLCTAWLARSGCRLDTPRRGIDGSTPYLRTEFEAVWVNANRSGFDEWKIEKPSVIVDREFPRLSG